MHEITGKELKEKIKGKKVIAICISPKSQFKKVHFKGAINIPFSEKSFIDKLKKRMPEKEQALALCCEKMHSKELQGVANKLEKAGYSNIYKYEAGVEDWKSSNLEVVRG